MISRRHFIQRATVGGAVLVTAGETSWLALHASQNAGVDRDREAVDRAEEAFLQAVSPQKAFRSYQRETDGEKRRKIFLDGFQELLVARDFGDIPNGRPVLGATSISWRQMLLSLVKGLAPGGIVTYASMIEAAPKMPAMGTSMYPRYDENYVDKRAKAFLVAAQAVVSTYLPEAAERFLNDPPHVQARSYVTALLRLQEAQEWPTTWEAYLLDARDFSPTKMQFDAPGSLSKRFFVALLGQESAEYQAWDHETGLRKRGEILRHARKTLFEKSLRALSDPPGIAIGTFKTEINFRQWTMYDPTNDVHVVGAAFGKEAAAKFSAGRTAAGPSDATKEIDDLYRAAVVMSAASYIGANMLL